MDHVWVETKAFFVRDENQRAVGIMGVTRDITEQAGKNPEKLARELLENLNRPESRLIRSTKFFN